MEELCSKEGGVISLAEETPLCKGFEKLELLKPLGKRGRLHKVAPFANTVNTLLNKAIIKTDTSAM